MATPERLIVDKLMRHVKQMRSRGHLICCRKVHGTVYSTKGEPDLDICYNGRSVKIEVKVPGARPTKIQEARMAEWEASGAYVGVACDVVTFETILEKARCSTLFAPQLHHSRHS